MRQLLLLAGLVAGATGPAHASTRPDSGSEPQNPVAAAAPDTLPAPRRYAHYHAIGQFAGGQGLATVGLGYALHRRLDVDLLAGYVPVQYSITPMGVFTAKATCSPWIRNLGVSRWQVYPLSVGGLVSYTASHGFNKTRDDKYEKGYYWWSAHTRIGGFVGGRVAYRLPNRPHKPVRTAALYYELGSNDLYITSIWKNMGALPLSSILTLGFGVKLDVF